MGDDAVHDDVLDTLTQWGVGALGEKLGIEFISADRERVVATMPVEGNTQPFGLLHGGASAVLAESLGSIHGTLLVAPESVVVGLKSGIVENWDLEVCILAPSGFPCFFSRRAAR